MQECEENAKAAAGSSEPATDVKIPSDLNMGWRDEMARSAGTEGGKPLAERSQIEQSDTESVELAEGFVPTASESIVSNSTALTSRGAVAGPGEEWSLARPAYPSFNMTRVYRCGWIEPSWH
ncbi:hypothetical protein C8034_v010609 [Colletotrichum sidae]|uniref:Uncharacterized protein n=1 Tax=Colletotrichum sidae TaxID=1347389 RepID=A0A4R8T142_9PEZI|nr:hypothetical protein C8034_v010609 [Colletotrichum sidae]